MRLNPPNWRPLMAFSILCSLALLPLSKPALAESFYGVGLSQVDHNIDEADDTTSTEFHAGYRWHPNFAVSLTHLEFGAAEFSDLKDEGSATGINLMALASLTPEWELFTFAGLHYWELNLSSEEFGLLDKGNGVDTYLGVGTTYQLNPLWHLGVRYSLFFTKVDEAENDYAEQNVSAMTLYLELRLP